MVTGYYDHTRVSGPLDFPRGLKPHEFSNALFQHCDRAANRINYDELDSKTGGKVKLVHYVVPLTEHPEISSGDDVMYFERDPSWPSVQEWYYAPSLHEGDPRFGDYERVRIVYAYRTDFLVDPALTRRGGRFTVTLSGVDWPVAFDPVAAGAITWQADQMAITETTYLGGGVFVTKFKRGNMPNEAYGKHSEMGLHLEFLDSTVSNFSAQINVEEMFYDLSYGANLDEPFQNYINRPEAAVSALMVRSLCLRLPALRMEYYLKRGDHLNESYIQPYEYLEPYIRHGNYMQELKAHMTVWGSAEVHPLQDGAGLVGRSGGFAWISNIGTSSIPFREYLTTGSKQLIPSAPETGRVEWNDIWGRRWHQPIRSVFIDVPPIPPPVRNFMSTVTFEMLEPYTHQRRLFWQSDERLIVRVQVKLLNNYPKWFEVTNCLDNQVLQLGPGGSSRIFDGFPPSRPLTDTVSDTQMVVSGHNASYGVCMSSARVVLEAQELTPAQRDAIQTAQHCTTAVDWYAECEGLFGLSVPVIHRRPDSSPNVGKDWMYIEEVESHWPQNYIQENMWDMTHYDYDDTAFDKAYKYHMDNNLPGIDKSIIKPENIYAFPLFKGLGYEMTYNKERRHINFPGKRGWWSDNLQNRDHTVVAGQDVSNAVAVGQDDLTEPLGWISAEDLTPDMQGKLDNIYACEFNRYRVKIDPQSGLNSHPQNVYINNVVPIDPTLDRWDDRLTNYECNLNEGMYSPDNISQFDNYLFTDTGRDWLYFASNLRGNAKENVNVLYDLNPLTVSRREGITKVQDGGRFVYWNPCCSRNTFLIVDNPVSTVIAQRTDLELRQEVLPTVSTTFGAVVMQLLHLSDPDEIMRKWNMPIYINHFGFGDATISTYVGGYEGSGCVLQPGDVTYIKVEFFNNAGFDWNLKVGAINATEIDDRAISGNDLLSGMTHSVQLPLAFNFMSLEFADPTLEPFITIIPSPHNIDTAPMFFDFENINVATIRDGFKGQYYYKMTVSPSLPDSYRGRLHEITVRLNKDYFNELPGFNDPTPEPFQSSNHNYDLEIPPIVFGVPFSSTSSWPGSIFYTSGYAENVHFTHIINSDFDPRGCCVVTLEDIDELRLVSSNPESRASNLEAFWSALNTTCQQIPLSYVDIGSGQRLISYNLSVLGDKFPFPVEIGPDIADIYMLLFTYADQLEPGWVYASHSSRVDFTDSGDKSKYAHVPYPFLIRVAGAYIRIELYVRVLDNNLEALQGQLDPQTVGVLEVTATMTNVGTDIAYHVDLMFDVHHRLRVVPDLMDYPYQLDDAVGDETLRRLTVLTDQHLPPGEPFSTVVFLQFGSMTQAQIRESSNYRLFIDNTHTEMDLTEIYGERRVLQTHDEGFIASLIPFDKGPVPGGLVFLAVVLSLAAVAAIAALIAALVYKRRVPYSARTGPSGFGGGASGGLGAGEPDLAGAKTHTVNIDYLMAGARRVTVKDGNPLSVDDDAPEEEKSPEVAQNLVENMKFWRKICP